MAGINKAILVGNLGLDPEIRTLESGAKLARIRIATSESYTTKEGQRVEQTEWHNVTMWRQLADIAEKYLSKGKQVYIEGKLRTRSYTDKDNVERYSTEIVADTMQMLGKVGGSNNDDQPTKTAEGGQETKSAAATHSAEKDDDLPF